MHPTDAKLKLMSRWPVQQWTAARSARASGGEDGGGRSWWRRWWALLTVAAVLILTPTAVLLAKAASYQPLVLGGAGVSTLAYPGLPDAHGARVVNTFGGVREDVYIPPQPKGYTFYLFAAIANYGSRAVTIESVSMPRDSALTPAGPVRYAVPSQLPGAPAIPAAERVLHSVTLGPGEGIFLAIPVRSWPCWTRYAAFATVPYYYVTYRFLFFTHTVAMPWGDHNNEVILHAPYGLPGKPNVVCIANP